MEKSEIIEFLKNNLRIEVSESIDYTGGLNGQPLYANSKCINLILCDETISKTCID